MGAQTSRIEDVSEDISEIVNKSIISNKSSCSSAVISTQKINLGDIGGDLNMEGINMRSSQTVNLSCLQNSDNNVEIVNEIKRKMETNIKNKLDGQTFGLQNAYTKSVKKGISSVVNSINIDNIKKCIVNAINEQTISVGNVAGNANIRYVSLDATQDVVQECVQNDRNTTRQISKLESEMKTALDNTVVGVISSTGFIIIAVVVLILLFVLIYLRSSKSSKNQS